VNRSKHQHWVPQFYLRHFATPESRDTDQPQVWIFSKDDADGDETLTNVRNVCGKRYLYSPVGDSEERVWDLDTKLEGLESTMGTMWPSLAEGFVDLADPTLRKGLSLFIAVMHLRNPEIRKAVERIHRNLVELYEDIPPRPDGTPNVESVEIAGETYNLDTNGWNEYRAWEKNDHDRFFTHVIESEATRIADVLMQKRWSVILSEREAFVTTDKPVVLQHQSRRSFGFRTPGVIVSFPLGPKRLLVTDDMHHEPANQYYSLQESAEGAFNLAIWKSGSRFMVTGRPVHHVLAEIVKWAEAHDSPDA
jgi:hypothetical protein